MLMPRPILTGGYYGGLGYQGLGLGNRGPGLEYRSCGDFQEYIPLLVSITSKVPKMDSSTIILYWLSIGDNEKLSCQAKKKYFRHLNFFFTLYDVTM